MVLVTDETPAEILEALTYVNRLAKRAPAILGTVDYPTDWDAAHRSLDQLLTDWQARTH